MSRAGRDARGRWMRDDATTVQAIRELAEAIDQIAVILADIGMDTDKRIWLAGEASQHVADAREVLHYIDVGRKPKGVTA